MDCNFNLYQQAATPRPCGEGTIAFRWFNWVNGQRQLVFVYHGKLPSGARRQLRTSGEDQLRGLRHVRTRKGIFGKTLVYVDTTKPLGRCEALQYARTFQAFCELVLRESPAESTELVGAVFETA